MNYYNEWDPLAAAWLRELIANKLIPRGLVDERSITDVTPGDLVGFTQCHFFAGIGGWSRALELAGVPATARLWTGSPPCQPFSTAGQQQGQFDPRHLAPVFLRLIAQCRPPVVFGEQVAAAIAKSWMCDLQIHMENEGYAVGFAVLPACGVGAPHKRERLFFGAVADNTSDGRQQGLTDCRRGDAGIDARQIVRFARGSDTNRVANADSDGSQGRLFGRSSAEREAKHRPTRHGGPADGPASDNEFWGAVDWLGCRDGKFRPVEPGTFPLADGIPARVGRLRGYGNAIVPQIAAEFVRGFLGAVGDAAEA
jgi:DNA (cytosine-5)-methyltransferase 1